ncbi:MAG: carboxypeptidase-like regulatory domain-containing protein, partial [Candidatus Micrarchaeaceae archaeon]
MKRFALGVILFIAVAAVVSAQLPTAAILGTVKDTSGASVAGATLTARNVDTNQTRTTVSDAGGAYRFAALPVGNYEVRAERTGFEVVVRSGLSLVVSQQAVVDFTLQLGAVSQTVEVVGAAPLVDTTSSSLSSSVSPEQVSNLPLNGRNYVQLALL